MDDISIEKVYNQAIELLMLYGPKTLSGLIVEYLEDIPDANLSLRIAGYPIEVLEVKENMVKLVKVIPSKRIQE